MKEKEFRLLIEKGWLVIPDAAPDDYLPSKEDKSLRAALKVELARNFGICLLSDTGITAEYVIQFFEELKEEGKLITQPYFPSGILPVDTVEPEDLVRRINKNASPITKSELKRKIVESKNPDSLELGWLGDKLEDGPNKVMVKFLSSFLKGGRIKAERNHRGEFMRILNYYSQISPEHLILEDYWKKIALWIHPSDFPDFPEAQKLLFGVLKIDKKEPEKPKLKKLMWAGWKEGKDFEVFESYLDQAGLTPTDLLKSIRDYERDPRVSYWKKTYGVEFGKEHPEAEESEVVDLMLLQLKEKLLVMIKPKASNLKIPESFYKIPAHHILKFPVVIAEEALPEDVWGFKIKASRDVHLITYNLEGMDSLPKEWGDLKYVVDFFIVGYQERGWKRTKLTVSFLNQNKEVMESSDIGINEEVKSLILFGYNSKTRTLKWIGEPSKTYYSGKPGGIKNWKRVWNILMERKTILSLGELAEKMYQGVTDESSEMLTIERMRRDLCQ